MKIFKDSAGRDWAIIINVGTVKRVRAMMDADLLDIGSTFERLMVDPVFLVDVLWCVCKPQAESKQNPPVSEEDFGASFRGDVISQARQALMPEIRDFFPTPEEREAADVAMQKGNTLRALIRDQMVAMIRKTDNQAIAAKIVEEAKEELERIFGNSPTDSPESSGESIPTDTPSGNLTG